MTCAICASRPTVKSHLIPRAIFHDMKRPGRPIVSGGAGLGSRLIQSGDWDSRILCQEHEAQLGAADRYGVEFCRAYAAADHSSDVELPNRQPHLLVDFTLACIWRFAASRHGGKPARILGLYADLIEGSLFGPGERFDPPLLVTRFRMLDHAGEALNIALLPAPQQEFGVWFWRFVVRGLCFSAMFDQRPIPQRLTELAINDKATVALPRAVARHVDGVSGLVEAFERMLMPRPRPPKRR